MGGSKSQMANEQIANEDEKRQRNIQTGEQRNSRSEREAKAVRGSGLFGGGSVEAGFALGAAEGDDAEARVDLRACGFAEGEQARLGFALAPPGQVDGLGWPFIGDEAADHFFLTDEAGGFAGHGVLRMRAVSGESNGERDRWSWRSKKSRHRGRASRR